MALFLVQHGRCPAKEIDPDRPLSEKGEKEVNTIAGMAAAKKIHAKEIIHSGKKRAFQTAFIYSGKIQPEKGVQQADGLNPNDDPSTILPRISRSSDLMIVGHLPQLDKLVSLLITGSTSHKIVRFQNGGIVCLDRDAGSNLWTICWTLFLEI